MGVTARFRSSLTYPIAATLVLVTVVPVALVGLLLARYNRDHLTTVEKQYLTRQAVSLASEVSLFFSGHRTQLESTARALQAGPIPDMPAFAVLLRDMAAEPDRFFIYLQVVDAVGEGTFAYPPELSAEAVEALRTAAQEAHETAVKGVRVEQLQYDLPAGRPVSVLALPLRTNDGETWGSLAGVLDLSHLRARLEDDARGGLLVSVIDDDGAVVVSSNPRLRGRSLVDAPLIRTFLRRPMRLNQSYLHPVDEKSGRVIGSAAPIPSLGWGVVVERSVADAFAPVRVMQQRTLLVSAVAALVALAIGFGLSRRLVVPLQNLAQVSSEIADGNLTERAVVSGHDELARLAANFNHMAGSVEALVRRLRHALRQNQELFLETIRTLAAAIDAKDPYTRGHSERVSAYSMAIARHLGIGQEELFRIRIAAILHDVGKLGVRDGILNKPGGLTEDEYAIMRRHPDIGAQIMAPIRMLKDIIPGIRNHHETWDGTGYPDRLAGDEIPLVARIIGAADTFDAMTTERPYQRASSAERVVDAMNAMAGSRFDPAVIDALVAAVESGDITPPAAGPGAVDPHVEHPVTESVEKEVS